MNIERIEVVPQLSNQVRFDPWVGANYGRRSRFGIGVLVLGEAHYGLDDEYDRNLTIDLTADYKERRWNCRFWTPSAGTRVAGLSRTFAIPSSAPNHSTRASLSPGFWPCRERKSFAGLVHPGRCCKAAFLWSYISIACMIFGLRPQTIF